MDVLLQKKLPDAFVLRVSRTLQFQAMKVDDIHAVIAVVRLCSLGLSNTALQVQHSFVFVKAEILFLPDTVDHILRFKINLRTITCLNEGKNALVAT